VLATALTVVSTVACAWRWHLVARGVDVVIAVPAAVAWCYRSQLLNTVLPGGVVGDVHRGVRHGRDAGDTGASLRAVAWERVGGQVVFLVVAAVLLVALGSPVGRVVPAAALVAAVVAAVFLRSRRRSPGGLLDRRTWPGVALASVVATACYVATYLLAARAVGVDAPLLTLVPLGVLVLVAAGLPLSFAGWGPREGAAAWVFAAAGLGLDRGVAAAVAYGALVLVANLPGAVVLLAAPLVAGRRPGASTPGPARELATSGGGRA
jgi:uncharacterized membrane protein YbhN (UPF0104 family)